MNKGMLAVFGMAGLLLSGCITTSMQGYADRELPARPVKRIATYVVAPVALASSLQTSIAEEASKDGISSEDAYALLPPTRTYNDADIKKVLNEGGVDAVLIVSVGDSGIQKEYAGTFFQGQYSGTSEANGTMTRSGNVASLALSGSSSGAMTGTATPINRYSRQTTFNARLIEVASARNLWVGSGQVNAGGKLFVGSGANASQTAVAIFQDLRTKKIISPLS